MRRSLVALAAVAVTAGAAHAKSSYTSTWQGLYPGSASDDNVIGGTGSACRLCHQNNGGPFNGYGWKIREGLNGGLSLTDAILAAEGTDADQDPTLSSSLDEIGADTQPGWTAGPYNTIYFSNGSTQEGQDPPAGVLGSLDPTIGTAYCGPAVDNSTGAPARIAATGSDVVTDDDVTLIATQLPPNQFGYFLNSQTQGFVANPGGSQGNLCLAGGIGRYSKQAASSGSAGLLVLTLDLTNTPTPAGPVAVQPGETWNFTTWYRDKNPNTTSNFTDGVSITFQ